jgi:hypothetical protein
MCRAGADGTTVVRTDSGSYDDIEDRWRSIAFRLVKWARKLGVERNVPNALVDAMILIMTKRD